MQERCLSAGDTAAHLGVSRDTIYKWLVPKNMPAHRVGSLWKFLPSGVVTVPTRTRATWRNCELLQISPSGILPILNDALPIA